MVADQKGGYESAFIYADPWRVFALPFDTGGDRLIGL
jgi:hypothetical protein